jgi:hypothetical protein
MHILENVTGGRIGDLECSAIVGGTQWPPTYLLLRTRSSSARRRFIVALLEML